MVRVVVVGGGVNGIGTAVALMQQSPKCQITVIAKEFTPDTTGDGAAGFWGPYLNPGSSQEKILQWGGETWNLFRDWWKSGENWGVYPTSGVVLDRQDKPDEFWCNIPHDYRRMSPEQCRAYGPGYCFGYKFTSYTAEGSRFLPKLMSEIKINGGVLERKSIESLEDVAHQADLIINCSGLGAKDLVPDENVYPCRGQVIRVRAPWIHEFFCDESDESFCYIIPNMDTVVLGGTHVDDDWNREIDPKDSEKIWENCIASMPSLKSCEVVQEWVGLRPGRRGGIRIETDEIKVNNRTVPVVHNYGHGGCGVTTFWGCGKEAASIASKIIHKQFGPYSKL